MEYTHHQRITMLVLFNNFTWQFDHFGNSELYQEFEGSVSSYRVLRAEVATKTDLFNKDQSVYCVEISSLKDALYPHEWSESIYFDSGRTLEEVKWYVMEYVIKKDRKKFKKKCKAAQLKIDECDNMLKQLKQEISEKNF